MSDVRDLASQFLEMPGLSLNVPAPAPRTFLFEDEVVDRYRDKISKSTLEKWRGNGEGPGFAYLGRQPVYPLIQLMEWELSLPVYASTSEKSSEVLK